MAVTNNLTLIHACNALTDATTSHVLSGTGSPTIKTYAADEIYPKEGTGCYGVDLDVETLYMNIAHASSSWNLTNSVVYVWFKSITPDYLDTWQNAGVTCRLLDASSNYSEWYLTGSDNYDGGWIRLCFSTSTTPDAVSGTLNVAAVTNIRFYFTGAIKSKLSENTLIDYVHYGADGTGITVTGGTSGTPETFDDVVGDDFSAAIGLISRQDGVYLMNGPITFGDSGGTSDMYFADENQVVVSKNKERTFTTANRTASESLVSEEHYTFNVKGNSTGTISFMLGNAAGTAGYGGVTFKTGRVARMNFRVSTSYVDALGLYGCNFIGLGDVSLVDDSSHEVYSCLFSGCYQVDPVGAPVIRNCTFSATTDSSGSGSALKWNNSIDIENCSFVANTHDTLDPHAIEHPDAGTFAYVNLVFAGNDYDVYFTDTSGSLVINASGTSNPDSYETTSGSVFINATKQYKLEGLIPGTEIRAYVGTNPLTATYLDGVESSGSEFSFQHQEAGNQGYIIMHKEQYVPINLFLTYPSTDTTIPVTQRLDYAYYNP